MPIDWPYFEKILTLIAGNDAPDVFLIDADKINIYADSGQIRDLEPFVAASTDLKVSDLLPEVVPFCRWKGKLHALPNQFYTFVVYYNKDLFDSAGLPYPSPDWTWDEFVRIAEKLTVVGRNGVVSQFGLSGFGGSQQYLVLAMEFGASVLDRSATRCELDSPAALEAARLYKDLKDTWHIAPRASESENLGPMAAFQLGKAAMHISGQWLIPELRNYQNLRWSVAPMPHPAGRPVRTYLGVHAFVMSSQTRFPDAAWKFIRYTAGRNAQEMVASLRINMPVFAPIAYSEKFAYDKTRPDDGNLTGLEARKYGFIIDSTPRCPVTLIQNILDTELEKCIKGVGTATPEQAMREATRRIDEQLGSRQGVFLHY